MGSSGVAGALVQRIREAQANAGLSTVELSKRTGIPDSTLDRKLRITPEMFNIRELEAIAAATAVTFEWLGFGITAQVAA